MDEGLGRLFCIWLGRDEVIKEAIRLLKDARARKFNYSQEYEAYSVLIDLLRRHLSNQPTNVQALMSNQSPTFVPYQGLTPAEALAALYNASKPQGLGFLHFRPTNMQVEEAQKVLANGAYVDYLNGRVIKCNFGPDGVDVRLFNRDLGPGAGERALRAAREARHG